MSMLNSLAPRGLIGSTRPPSPRGTVQRPLRLLHESPVIYTGTQTAVGGVGHIVGNPPHSVGTASVVPRIWAPFDPTDVCKFGFIGRHGTEANNTTAQARVWIVEEVIGRRPGSNPEYIANFACDLDITIGNVAVNAASEQLPVVSPVAKFADTIAIVGADETLAPGIRIIHDRADGGMAIAVCDRVGAVGCLIEPFIGGAYTSTGLWVVGGEA